MSKQKHTPGPWTIEEPLENNLSIVQEGKQTYEWFFIANCMLPDEDDHDFTAAEVRANAQLIAAAPEMRKALECIQEVAASLNGASVHVRERAIKQINGWCAAALAKSEGRA